MFLSDEIQLNNYLMSFEYRELLYTFITNNVKQLNLYP